MKKQTDIIIVGSGLAATAFAASLAGMGLHITILEKSLPHFDRAENDLRPISLNLASVNTFMALGLWGDVTQYFKAIQQVVVSQQGKFGAIRFEAGALNVPMLGCVVSYDVLMKTLYNRAVDLGCHFLSVASIDSIESTSLGATIVADVSNEKCEMSASLIVAADGVNSACRDLLGVTVETKQCGDIAIVCQLYLHGDYDGCARQRITQGGTLALLPMFNGKECRLVWTMSSKMKSEVDSWGEAQLLSFVTNVFSGYLPGIDRVKLLSSYPLKYTRARQQVKGNIVLLGNSAHSFYPITAQGFNLTLRDIAVLAQLIYLQIQAGGPLNGSQYLQEYADWCVPEQEKIIQLTATMDNFFGFQLPGISILRSMSFAAIEMLPFIKSSWAQRLMGMSGKVPNLSRGIALV